VKGDDLLLWILVALLLAAIAITVLFAPGKSRHGYGGTAPPAGPEDGALPQTSLLDRAVSPRL
jgi:hypothetical protein